MNQIQEMRERLGILGDLILTREQIEKLITRFAPSYTISELSLKGVIIPLKRGKSYINNFSEQEQDPYKVIDAYFDGEEYMIGGLGVYNSYGLSTQVAEWHTVYNTKVSGKRIIGNNKYILKKEVSSFFYGKNMKKQRDFSYNIMSPERAVIQMIRDKATLEYLPRFIDRKKLVDIAKKYSPKSIQDKIIKLCS